MPEQALIIQTNAGLIIVTGCGHPGVVELTKRAIELLKQNVLFVIGGFHLMGKRLEDIQNVAADLSSLTQYVAPCHCCGDAARHLFKQKLGKNDIEVGAGKVVDLSEHIQPEITNPIGMKLRLIPSGSYLMGGELDNERPRHQVEITKPFYMGIYEVTQEQYEKVMDENPSGFKGPDLPVESVSWNDAVEFCRRLSSLTHEKYRLPTEAEWEYAARGGLEGKRYVWGDQDVPEVSSCKQANVADASYSRKYEWPPFIGYDDGFAETSPVGSFAPNYFGLYDMAGNVWERCSDWYEDHYFSQSPEKDSRGPVTGTRKVLRGGGWGSGPHNSRIAFRCGSPLDRGGANDGFRVVKEVK
jgi:formylglycine-generating enzyme required for sulfatase activity